jgi:hypothetical protein
MKAVGKVDEIGNAQRTRTARSRQLIARRGQMGSP